MTKIKQGEKAPYFEAEDQSGKKITIDDFKGRKIVLFFYPKDDTPGCTKQACNLRDNYAAMQKAGYEVLGISNDPVKSHEKFRNKYSLPFSLLADTEKKMVNDYGVYGEKSFMGKKYMGIIRTTFVIDEDQKIEKIISDIKTGDHTNQILK
ncbi:MAG: thioredoxin-dependent thiol peroxidase [Bacteroidia bacterium]|jgi:peroxiredoxin Q/BCP